MAPTATPDRLDAAIAGADSLARPASLMVTLPTGRQAGLLVPLDLTVAEAFALLGYITGHLGAELERMRGPKIAVVHGALPPSRRT